MYEKLHIRNLEIQSVLEKALQGLMVIVVVVVVELDFDSKKLVLI